jgi:ABC-2 type transport system ATP-binding protein
MDTVARLELLDLIAEQAKDEGRTTVFSGHVVAEISRISHVIGILDGGRLQWEGRASDVSTEHREILGELPESLSDGLTLVARREEEGVVHKVLVGAVEAWEGSGLDARPLDLEEVFLAHALYRVGR